MDKLQEISDKIGLLMIEYRNYINEQKTKDKEQNRAGILIAVLHNTNTHTVLDIKIITEKK